MSAKGSAMGSSTFPEYMRETHGDWLGNVPGSLDPPANAYSMIYESITVTELMIDIIDAASPYNGFDYTSPTTAISNMRSAVGLLLAEKESLASVQTNWDTLLNKAFTEVSTDTGADIETLQTLVAAEWEDLDDQARVQLATLINSGHIAEVSAYFNTWSGIYTAVKAKADSDITDRIAAANDRSGDTADRHSDVTDRQGDVTDRSAIIVDRSSHVTDRSGNAVDNSAVVLAEVDEFGTVYTDILARINTLISVDDYKLSDVDIQTIVDSVEDDIDPKYEKLLSEYAGGMASINAVNSSAFMIGMALILRQKTKDLSKADADLRRDNTKNAIQFYQDRLRYVEAFARAYSSIDFQRAAELNRSKISLEDNIKTLMSSYENTKAQVMTSYEDVHGQAMLDYERTKAGVMSNYETLVAQLVSDYEKTKATLMAAYEDQQARLAMSYETLYTGFLTDMNRVSAEIDRGKATVLGDLHRAHEDRRVQYVTGALKGMITMLISLAQLRGQLASQGIGIMSNQYQASKGFVPEYVKDAIETERMAQVMTTEHEERELHADVKDTLWDLSVYQYGANILSAIGTGGGGYIPDGPSPVGQALSGAMGGASLAGTLGASMTAGSEVGFLAGPGGIAVGALVGLAAGLATY